MRFFTSNGGIPSGVTREELGGGHRSLRRASSAWTLASKFVIVSLASTASLDIVFDSYSIIYKNLNQFLF